MRIEHAETIPYALPFRRPYATARGTLERREAVLLRLRTAEGAEGLGEAVPLSLRGGASLGAIREHLDSAAARLEGLELDPSGAAVRPLDLAIATVLELARPRRMPAPAVAALEMALFDLAAQAEDAPLWRTLGANGYEPVRCNATLVAGAPEAVATEARDWLRAGFATFKLKLGAGHDDVATVAAVREAVGPDARIRVDVNATWRAREAIDALRALDAFGIELCEQPVAGLRAMARVARDSPVPLAADEDVASEADANRARQRRACEYVTAKLSKVGGIGASVVISRVLPTYLSSALDGPVGIAAAAHCAQVCAPVDLAHGLATQRLFAETVVTSGTVLDGDRLVAPSRPGLGVQLDEVALEHHRLPA